MKPVFYSCFGWGVGLRFFKHKGEQVQGGNTLSPVWKVFVFCCFLIVLVKQHPAVPFKTEKYGIIGYLISNGSEKHVTLKKNQYSASLFKSS